MARNISFALTTRQFRDRTKDVTRRKGWKSLKAGDILNGCVKCMGLKPGEAIERLGQIMVTNARREPLNLCDDAEAVREGFPELTGEQFVEMYCSHMGGTPDQEVTRIEYTYLEPQPVVFHSEYQNLPPNMAMRDFIRHFEEQPGIDKCQTNLELISELFLRYEQTRTGLTTFHAPRGSGTTTTLIAFAKWIKTPVVAVAHRSSERRWNHQGIPLRPIEAIRGLNILNCKKPFIIIDSPLSPHDRKSAVLTARFEMFLNSMKKPAFYVISGE